MTRTLSHFIGGRWVEGSRHTERENPSDWADIVARVPAGGEKEVFQAVSAAGAAFEAWAGASPEFRSDCLDRIARSLMQRSEEIGAVIAREEGKLVQEAIGEVRRASRIFQFFSGEAIRLHGDAIRSVRPGVDVTTHRDPVGVFGLITPWNFPVAIPAWKAAPALAFGNTVVLKPSGYSPLTAALLGEIVEASGVPGGVFNIVFGDAEAGMALCRDEAVAGISFTGSQAVGRKVAAAAIAHQARVQLEMGGNNPLVVLDDCDLDRAVEVALDGSFYSSGQRCTASSRLIVQKGVQAAFTEKLVLRMKLLTVGDARDPGTKIGPLASRGQLEKCRQAIAGATGQGARLLSGGETLPEGRGYFLRPALLGDTRAEMEINQTEVFGPVATLIPADDFEHALSLANASPFGLSAGIVSRSAGRIAEFRRRIVAGMVMVNLPTAGVDYHVPFGGVRGSSYGPREQGTAAAEFYTQVKTSYLWA